MTMEELEADVRKLVGYIQYLGNNFKILRAKPLNHIGAIIADAVLQVGHRWKQQVEPRVNAIQQNYPQGATISGLLELLKNKGAGVLLDWDGKDEQKRFSQTTEFFKSEQIETVKDLRNWLKSNRDRLLTNSPLSNKAGIAKVGDKTADYYCVLVGLPDAVAVDRLIRNFLEDAGITKVGASNYNRTKMIVQKAAERLSKAYNRHIVPVDLDHSIWEFQVKNLALKTEYSQPIKDTENRKTSVCFKDIGTIEEENMNHISKLPALGRALVEATIVAPHSKAKKSSREISIDKGWTACLVCWGGPLDISTVQANYGAYWSTNKRSKQPALWIPVTLWIASNSYHGKLGYYLKSQDSYISNTLNNGKKLGPIMTAAGFKAKQKIFLKVIKNEVWVL